MLFLAYLLRDIHIHIYMDIWVLILKMVIHCAHCMHRAFSSNIVSWILFKMSLLKMVSIFCMAALYFMTQVKFMWNNIPLGISVVSSFVTVTNDAAGSDCMCRPCSTCHCMVCTYSQSLCMCRPCSTRASSSAQTPGSGDADLGAGTSLLLVEIAKMPSLLIVPGFSTVLPMQWIPEPSSGFCLTLCLCLALTEVSRTGYS